MKFWKTDEKDKPEQYRIKVVETAPQSIVSVQDPNGAPDQHAGEREDPRAAERPAEVARPAADA